MVFVDTSVWVDFLRGRDARLIEELRRLLDADDVGLAAPVRLEILGGASADNLRRLRSLLSALPVFYPARDTWTLAERFVERAVAARERFGVGDLVIGALAAERGGRIWSLDRDFSRLARLGLVKLHRPR